MKETLRRVKQRYYRCGGSRDVKAGCRNCPTCSSQRKPLKKVQDALQADNLCVLAPLPETDQGNRYFVLVKDLFGIHESTGCLPNELMFGRDVRLLVDLMFASPPVPVTPPDSTANDRRYYMIKDLERIREGENSSGQERQKPEDADSMGRSVGDYQTSCRRSISNPEDPKGKPKFVHHDLLKPFHERNLSRP